MCTLVTTTPTYKGALVRICYSYVLSGLWGPSEVGRARLCGTCSRTLLRAISMIRGFVLTRTTEYHPGPCGLTFSAACACHQERIALLDTLFRLPWLRVFTRSGGGSYQEPLLFSRSPSHSRLMPGYTDPRTPTTYPTQLRKRCASTGLVRLYVG